jgi:hypothetical protein
VYLDCCIAALFRISMIDVKGLAIVSNLTLLGFFVTAASRAYNISDHKISNKVKGSVTRDL